MALKIYTKTGDGGKTSLIGGTKVSKASLRIESYGNVDELNSYLGLVMDYSKDDRTIATIREIQDRLFTIGASLACDPDKEPLMKMPDLKETDVTFLEQEIDFMNEVLEPMKFFVLPGGHPGNSHAHVARCICRRAERTCVNMKEQGLYIDDLVIKYINRLSDYLFVVARYIGHTHGVEELKWKPRVQ